MCLMVVTKNMLSTCLTQFLKFYFKAFFLLRDYKNNLNLKFSLGGREREFQYIPNILNCINLGEDVEV